MLRAYSFNYSARPGTPAADMEEMVAKAVMNERLARLRLLIDAEQAKFNDACSSDAPLDVLFERAGTRIRPDRRPHRLICNPFTSTPAPTIIGQMHPMTIDSNPPLQPVGALAAPPLDASPANSSSFATRNAIASPAETGA